MPLSKDYFNKNTNTLKLLSKETRTIILYISPHKLIRTLEQIITYFGGKRCISVSRELTKIFEETFRGTLESALIYFKENPPRGEIVLVISGA